MRMRKKKNLESRLADCKNRLIIIDIDREDRNFNNAAIFRDYIDFGGYFEREAPLHLEIGCGKGQFACEIARQNPDINFIAVEKSANVIVSACEKAIDMGLKNLVFMKCSAEYLNSYIPDNLIERIYLNFSCPFPKKKYASHRLTAAAFLKIYKRLLTANAEIHMKTDNMGLFEFSIEQLSQNGFAIKNISLDLHNSGFEGNIVTEYESKFASLGLPIYRLEAYIKEDYCD